MLLARLGVWAAIMATVSKNGLGVLWKLIVFMGGFYLSLLILWGILVAVGFIAIGPRYMRLLRLIREPLMIAFSTASSEAAYPKTLEGLNRFGASSRISSFVLPLGYSFNLDGTMMYCTFASIFIAQTYHIEMSLGTQLAMLATLMITSKGVAGVPRASLVVIASTLSQFGIPEAGLLMIMGIDTFLDMGRSATNVIGNSLATSVVAKRDGQLAPEHAPGSHETALQDDAADLKSEYGNVSSADRISAVVHTESDRECGSTTANAERAKHVASSPLVSVTGTKVMVPKA